MRMRLHQRVQAVRIWEGEIQQHDIKGLVAQAFESCRQPVHMLQFHVSRASFAKQFQKQPHVTRVIFNEQDAIPLQVHASQILPQRGQYTLTPDTTWVHSYRSSSLISLSAIAIWSSVPRTATALGSL